MINKCHTCGLQHGNTCVSDNLCEVGFQVGQYSASMNYIHVKYIRSDYVCHIILMLNNNTSIKHPISQELYFTVINNVYNKQGLQTH